MFFDQPFVIVAKVLECKRFMTLSTGLQDSGSALSTFPVGPSVENVFGLVSTPRFQRTTGGWLFFDHSRNPCHSNYVVQST